MTENNLASCSFPGTWWGKYRPTFTIELGSCAIVMAAAINSCLNATLGIERFTSAFARKIYGQMVAMIKVEAWNFTIKTFKTCQFNESRLFICRLKYEHNCSRENAGNVHVSWMMLYKQGALKIFKCWNSVVVFPSRNIISGYTPGCPASSYQRILRFVYDLIYVVMN